MNRASEAPTGRSSGRLYQTLRKQILSGDLTPGDYLPAMRKLRAKHGLHMETVCRAMRRLEEDGLVLGEARRGYRVQARAGAADANCPLGLVLFGAEKEWDSFEQRLVGALQQEATRQGRVVLAIGRGRRAPAEVVGDLLAARVRGVLVNVPDLELMAALGRAGLPAVLVGTWHERAEVDSVAQDGFAGAMAAAMHLVARGHCRIGWLGYPVAGNVAQVAERFAGAVGGLARVGARLDEELCFTVPEEDRAAAEESARRMLSLRERPSAVLALWQPAAVGLVRAAAKMGLVPGRDFEMVGWINEEAYDREYLPLFGGGPAQPAVTWSLGKLVRAALARIEERRASPELPRIRLKVPAVLRYVPADPGPFVPAAPGPRAADATAGHQEGGEVG